MHPVIPVLFVFNLQFVSKISFTVICCAVAVEGTSVASLDAARMASGEEQMLDGGGCVVVAPELPLPRGRGHPLPRDDVHLEYD